VEVALDEDWSPSEVAEPIAWNRPNRNTTAPRKTSSTSTKSAARGQGRRSFAGSSIVAGV